MSKERIYLAYGSNLNLSQMEQRCPTAKKLGTTELTGFDLKFRGGYKSAVATVEPGNGSVPALLWSISPKDEAALDRYEGWPRLYRKESVNVKLNGKAVNAMVYVMNEGHELGSPSVSYFSTILEGYRTAGFDPYFLADAVMRSQPEMDILHDRDLQW